MPQCFIMQSVIQLFRENKDPVYTPYIGLLGYYRPYTRELIEIRDGTVMAVNIRPIYTVITE